MGNILSKHSFDKKEEEFEKMWNENFQSSVKLNGYQTQFGIIFSKGKSYVKCTSAPLLKGRLSLTEKFFRNHKKNFVLSKKIPEQLIRIIRKVRSKKPLIVDENGESLYKK